MLVSVMVNIVIALAVQALPTLIFPNIGKVALQRGFIRGCQSRGSINATIVRGRVSLVIYLFMVMALSAS